MAGTIRKKNSRQRGSKTHGWGSMKKHRGAGHRGGRGNAGSGKRGDCKKPRYQKKNIKPGKYGFHSPVIHKKIKTINLSLLSQVIDKYVYKNLAKLDKDTYSIDLNKLGFDKLLGTGKINKKIVVDVMFASEKAVSKVCEVGGKVNLPTQNE